MRTPNTKRRRRSHPLVAAVVPALVDAVVPPVVASVVQPVAKRLARIEALLIEMRFELDRQAKRVSALKEKLDALADRRVSKRERSGNQNRRAQPANGTGLAQSR
jgi:hypothetical protein